jgi:NAD(P)-dependent dehydrogenase (short-subunit alcohol dehydrogenase family)
VLVTGTAHGIGSGIAEGLVPDDWRVILAESRGPRWRVSALACGQSAIPWSRPHGFSGEDAPGRCFRHKNPLH